MSHIIKNLHKPLPNVEKAMTQGEIYEELDRIYLEYILPLQGYAQMSHQDGFRLSVDLMDDVADLLCRLRPYIKEPF